MLSQFHDDGFIEASVTGRPLGQITVSGPLNLNLKEQQFPIAIHVMVVQHREGEHGPNTAKVAKGVLVINEGAATDEWRLTLTEDVAGDLKDGDARGIAVAVVPAKGLFAYDTFTWCEHIKLKVRPATVSAVDGEAGVGVDSA